MEELKSGAESAERDTQMRRSLVSILSLIALLVTSSHATSKPAQYTVAQVEPDRDGVEVQFLVVETEPSNGQWGKRVRVARGMIHPGKGAVAIRLGEVRVLGIESEGVGLGSDIYWYGGGAFALPIGDPKPVRSIQRLIGRSGRRPAENTRAYIAPFGHDVTVGINHVGQFSVVGGRDVTGPTYFGGQWTADIELARFMFNEVFSRIPEMIANAEDMRVALREREEREVARQIEGRREAERLAAIEAAESAERARIAARKDILSREIAVWRGLLSDEEYAALMDQLPKAQEDVRAAAMGAIRFKLAEVSEKPGFAAAVAGIRADEKAAQERLAIERKSITDAEQALVRTGQNDALAARDPKALARSMEAALQRLAYLGASFKPSDELRGMQAELLRKKRHFREDFGMDFDAMEKFVAGTQ